MLLDRTKYLKFVQTLEKWKKRPKEKTQLPNNAWIRKQVSISYVAMLDFAQQTANGAGDFSIASGKNRNRSAFTRRFCNRMFEE